MIDETIQKTYTTEDVQDQLFLVNDIIHAWPKSLKDPKHYQHIAPLFDPVVFWKWAEPWDVTICVHRDARRCEYLIPEHQCLLLKQHVEDTYNITLPSLPASFNSELWTGKWDLTVKQVNSEPEFQVYQRLARTATRNLKTAQKLERTAATRNRQLEMAREKLVQSAVSGGKFVSVDVECYEFDHNYTTELGISTMILPDGKITSRHLLIREYAHLRNNKFVPDMADAFDHGTSEWVHLRDCNKILLEAFGVDQRGIPVYFIGHDPMADIRYLEKNLRCHFPKGIGVFDTRLMFSAFGGDKVLRNLAHCLDELGIEYWNLHNAGNDAHYTLVAFKEMCTTVPKVVSAVEEKPAHFCIRDIVPEDLTVEPNQQESKAPENSLPKESPVISLGEFLNRRYISNIADVKENLKHFNHNGGSQLRDQSPIDGRSYNNAMAETKCSNCRVVITPCNRRRKPRAKERLDFAVPKRGGQIVTGAKMDDTNRDEDVQIGDLTGTFRVTINGKTKDSGYENLSDETMQSGGENKVRSRVELGAGLDKIFAATRSPGSRSLI